MKNWLNPWFKQGLGTRRLGMLQRLRLFRSNMVLPFQSRNRWVPLDRISSIQGHPVVKGHPCWGVTARGRLRARGAGPEVGLLHLAVWALRQQRTEAVCPGVPQPHSGASLRHDLSGPAPEFEGSREREPRPRCRMAFVLRGAGWSTLRVSWG